MVGVQAREGLVASALGVVGIIPPVGIIAPRAARDLEIEGRARRGPSRTRRGGGSWILSGGGSQDARSSIEGLVSSVARPSTRTRRSVGGIGRLGSASVDGGVRHLWFRNHQNNHLFNISAPHQAA